MRGTWTVEIHTDPKEPAVASQMFLVEDFVPGPHRVRPDQPTSDEIAAGETANVTVDGRFLYGAPAAGLALEGEVDAVDRRANGSASRATIFGLADEQEGEATRMPLTDLPLVGDDGKATFPVSIDAAAVDDAAAQRRRDGAHAREPAAAPSSARSTSTCARTATMIGIRPDFAGDEVPQGGTAKFKRHRTSTPTATARRSPALQWTLVKIERNYQWYRNGNYWNYEPVTSTEAVANGTIDIAADGEVSISHAGRLGPLPARDRDRRSDRSRRPATSSTPAGMSRRARPKRRTGSRSRSTRTTTRPAKSPS